MASYSGRNAAQKEFLKLFHSMTGAYSPWDIWKDMVWLFATAISNSVDKRFAERREEIYMGIIRRYSKEQQQIFPELLGQLVLNIQGNGEKGGYSDFLGELFMCLELGNDAGGQFFTPYHVCMVMAQLSMDAPKLSREIDRKGYISINDPACGAGATLIAAADVMIQNDINYQQTALFIGQDIDATTALMCYIQLSLLGCAGYVRIGNTLTGPMCGSLIQGGSRDEQTWYTPMLFSERWGTLRAVDSMRRLLHTTGAALTPAEPESPAGNIPDAETAVSAPERPTETEGPTITVKHKRGSKKDEGQLMFEF